MKKVTVAKASRSLGEYVTDLKDEIVVVTEGNRPVAALVPLKNVDRESMELSAHPEFLRLIKRSRTEIKAGKLVPLDEMRKRVLPKGASNKSRSQPTAAKRRGG